MRRAIVLFLLITTCFVSCITTYGNATLQPDGNMLYPLNSSLSKKTVHIKALLERKFFGVGELEVYLNNYCLGVISEGKEAEFIIDTTKKNLTLKFRNSDYKECEIEKTFSVEQNITVECRIANHWDTVEFKDFKTSYGLADNLPSLKTIHIDDVIHFTTFYTRKIGSSSVRSHSITSYNYYIDTKNQRFITLYEEDRSGNPIEYGMTTEKYVYDTTTGRNRTVYKDGSLSTGTWAMERDGLCFYNSEGKRTAKYEKHTTNISVIEYEELPFHSVFR